MTFTNVLENLITVGMHCIWWCRRGRKPR